MVEAQGPSPPTNDFSRINLDQLVHLKAFQTGHLTFDRKFITQPGRIFGTKRKPELFDNCSSFLPYQVLDRSNTYGPGQPFNDIGRPYRAGYVALPKDTGTQYDETLEENQQKVREVIQQRTEPIEVRKARL